MEFTPVDNDQWIWKRQSKLSDDMIQVLDKLEAGTPGVTYEIKLGAPVKSFRSIVRRHFEGRKLINIKAKDASLSAWYVRLEKSTSSPKKSATSAKETLTKVLETSNSGASQNA